MIRWGQRNAIGGRSRAKKSPPSHKNTDYSPPSSSSPPHKLPDLEHDKNSTLVPFVGVLQWLIKAQKNTKKHKKHKKSTKKQMGLSVEFVLVESARISALDRSRFKSSKYEIGIPRKPWRLATRRRMLGHVKTTAGI
ncbi:uncharacterized protein YALI1_F16715g [Yarrowia lipolytica]|uniref:Uncharacterized protein n=1 Tax=Yarrowia lipolytica TaxID=4952 RepID=A0A1D8NN42_YARLL|nr:hypothetical protein YALI1_F16715g [Yarrowia lipolytica]